MSNENNYIYETNEYDPYTDTEYSDYDDTYDVFYNEETAPEMIGRKFQERYNIGKNESELCTTYSVWNENDIYFYVKIPTKYYVREFNPEGDMISRPISINIEFTCTFMGYPNTNDLSSVIFENTATVGIDILPNDYSMQNKKLKIPSISTYFKNKYPHLNINCPKYSVLDGEIYVKSTENDKITATNCNISKTFGIGKCFIGKCLFGLSDHRYSIILQYVQQLETLLYEDVHYLNQIYKKYDKLTGVDILRYYSQDKNNNGPIT